jgi:hypothetical protein
MGMAIYNWRPIGPRYDCHQNFMIVDRAHPVANKNTEIIKQAVDFLVGNNVSIGIGWGDG